MVRFVTRAAGLYVLALSLAAAGPGGCVDDWLNDPAGQPAIDIVYVGPDSVLLGTEWTLEAEVTAGIEVVASPRLVWHSSAAALVVDSLTGHARAERVGAALVTVTFPNPASARPPSTTSFEIVVADTLPPPQSRSH